MNATSSTRQQAEDQAARLRAEWDERGRSDARDFYIASHPGWTDAAVRAQLARADATRLLRGLELKLHGLNVLEIGCGVGRLAAPVAARVLSYTGLDVAPSMVAEARARTAGLGGLRFLECDGLSVPPAARDRRYDLVLAHAVFVHCPRAVIAAWIASAREVLAPGGELRAQLRVDSGDPGGLKRAPTQDDRAQMSRQMFEVSALDLTLAGKPDYMGHAFGWDEAQAFLQEAAPGAWEIERLDLANLGLTVRA